MNDSQVPNGYILLANEKENLSSDSIKSLAQRLHFHTISEKNLPSDELPKLVFENNQWRVYTHDRKSTVGVDFFLPSFYARLSRQGFEKENVVRAVKGRNKATLPLLVLDATAGFGHDGFLLANAGCQLTMVEKNPLLAFLLAQAIHRVADSDDVIAEVASRIIFYEGDSVDVMKSWHGRRPDVVYLDPMYNTAEQELKRGLKKTAAVKKNMAFLQQIAAHNSTAEDQRLFEAAVEIAGSKVVIKRAPGAEHLAFQTPASSIEGKSARFDIYPL